MKIKVNIKSNTAASKMFKKYLEEKDAFKKAVKEGNVTAFVKSSGKKVDNPIPVN